MHQNKNKGQGDIWSNFLKYFTGEEVALEGETKISQFQYLL